MIETGISKQIIRARSHQMADEILLNLVVDIVSAHVGNNSVSAQDVPQLIKAVYGSLAKLGEAEKPVAEAARNPAVSIRASVKPDGITCLECGKKFQTIKRHLGSDHGLSVEEYRQRWNLPGSYPVVASDYAERRRELAKSGGLGRKKGSKTKTGPASAVETATGGDTQPQFMTETAPVPGQTAKAKPAKKAAEKADKPAEKPATKPRRKLGISTQ